MDLGDLSGGEVVDSGPVHLKVLTRIGEAARLTRLHSRSQMAASRRNADLAFADLDNASSMASNLADAVLNANVEASQLSFSGS
jgi:hypothetical protein